MAADDLNTPLGVSKKPRRGNRFPDPFPPLAALFLGVALAVTVWIVVTNDPLGGEPVGRVAIHRSTPAPLPQSAGETAAVSPGAASSHQAGPEVAGALATEALPAGPLIIKVPRAPGSAIASPGEEGLAETSRHGPLPRIADDGRRPMDLYARRSAADASAPRIALVVSGLGVSPAASRQAIERLPHDVTFAFVPYGEALPELVAEARRAGHEVLLQIPMEPFDYPNNDPGPQTLLTGLPASANLDRLHWAMGRAAGYAGITSYMGGKFASSEEALTPVLSEAARRGLFFLDSGAQPGTGIADIGAATGALVLKAGVAPGFGSAPEEIEAALRRAEDLTKSDGAATIMLALQPEILDRLVAWAASLKERGVSLVPASDLVRRPPARNIVGNEIRDRS